MAHASECEDLRSVTGHQSPHGEINATVSRPLYDPRPTGRDAARRRPGRHAGTDHFLLPRPHGGTFPPTIDAVRRKPLVQSCSCRKTGSRSPQPLTSTRNELKDLATAGSAPDERAGADDRRRGLMRAPLPLHRGKGDPADHQMLTEWKPCLSVTSKALLSSIFFHDAVFVFSSLQCS